MAQLKNNERIKVLIVEDEVAIMTLLRYNLEKEGFAVITTGNGEEAVNLIKENKPDIVVLDWMLPGMTGVEVCKHVRWNQDIKNTPIIMLSARGEEGDRIRGLDSGADDYMVKPFSPPELIARIHAVFRRIRPSLSEKVLEFSGIFMDLTTRKATRDGVEVHLSPTEFGLLRHLMEHPGRVFTREQLLDSVWGHDIYVEIRTVDVHIRRLRKALNYDGKQPDLVRTVRSAGYALEENPEGKNYINDDSNEDDAA